MQKQRQRTVRTRVSAFGVAIMTLAAVGLLSAPAGAAPSGSISGRVVDAGSIPLQGICVQADGNPPQITDAAGLYSLPNLSGSYAVQFSDCNPGPVYATQWFNGHNNQGDANPVAVSDGVDTPLVTRRCRPASP